PIGRRAAIQADVLLEVQGRDGSVAHLRAPRRRDRDRRPDPCRARSRRGPVSHGRVEARRPDRGLDLVRSRLETADALSRLLHAGRESPEPHFSRAREGRRQRSPARGRPPHRALMRTFWLALILPAAALAHQPSLSYSELRVRGREIDCILRLSLADLRTRVRIEDPRDAPVPALARLLLEPFAIRASDRPCALQPGVTADPDGEDGLALHARWLCPATVDEVSVRAGFLEALPPGHTHLSRVDFAADEVSQRVAQTDQPTFEAR